MNNFTLYNFNNLLQISTQSKTVEIIQAIGSTWPFLLTVTLILFIVIYRKEITHRLLKENNKIAVKTPVLEFSIEKPDIKNEISKEQNASVEIIEDKTIENIKEKTKPSFWEIYLELKEHKFDEANKFFEEIQSAEIDVFQKEKNILSFLYLKYLYGGIDTIKEIENLISKTTQQKLKIEGYDNLGDVHFKGGNFYLAIENFNKAVDLSTDTLQKTKISIKIATSKYEISGKNEAIHYLKQLLEKTEDNESMITIFRSFAAIYEKENDWLSKSLALEMALSLKPNDTDILFDVAYSYSNSYKDTYEKIVSMSLLHYKQLIEYDKNSSVGYNNLGVAYSNLDLEGLAVKSYKEAIKQNNTLASSNLSNKLIYSGFYEEAKSYLDIAQKQNTIHANIWTSVETLSKKEKEDKKSRKNYQMMQKLNKNF